MIYLIDEKRERQRNFGWSSELISKYSDIIFPVYNNNLLQDVKEQIFGGVNILLFHESFFDAPENHQVKDALQIRMDIIKYANEKDKLVVFFSGSICTRSIDQNSAHIPVEVLYQNLLPFCEKYRNNSSVSLRDIVFGSSFLKEEILLAKGEIWENLYDMKDDENLNPNPKLFSALEKLESLSGKIFLKSGISNGYLKNQLKSI